MDSSYGQWGRKGATLSDKTACRELGLSRKEIVEAINAGSLQYRAGSMHGNPRLRLLRSEVEELVRSKHGQRALEARKSSAELAHVDWEMKRLRRELAALEQRRAALVAALEGLSPSWGIEDANIPLYGCVGRPSLFQLTPGRDRRQPNQDTVDRDTTTEQGANQWTRTLDRPSSRWGA